MDTPNNDTSAKNDPPEQPSKIPSKVGLAHKVRNLESQTQSGHTRRDRVGNEYSRYVQTINGIPVFGGGMTVRNNLARKGTKVDNHFYNGIYVNTSPSISTKTASEAAYKYAGSMKQINSHEVKMYILHHEDSDYLTYAFQLEQLNEDGKLTMPFIFVDAHTSNIVWSYDNLKSFALLDEDKITYNHDTN